MLGCCKEKHWRGKLKIHWLTKMSDSMDRNLSKPWEIMKSWGAWRAAVQGVTKSRRDLSDLTTTTQKDTILLLHKSSCTGLPSHDQMHLSVTAIMSDCSKKEGGTEGKIHYFLFRS